MTSPDLPFVLRGGESEQTAIENRINAIERIKYLSGVDMRIKSPYYIKVFSLEMWQRWYSDDPKHKIDEEWCQRAAEVCRAMEVEVPVLDEAKFKAVFHDPQGESDVDKHVESSASNVGGQAKPDESPVRPDSVGGSDKESGSGTENPAPSSI